MTDQEVIKTKNDVEMIKRQYLWPGKFGKRVLPLTKTINYKLDNFVEEELGCIIPELGGLTTVFIINIYMIPYMTKDLWRTVKTYKYNSPEELIMWGWKVD